MPRPGLPQIILLFGDSVTEQRAIANELSDCLRSAPVLGFAAPLRDAFRATWMLPIPRLVDATTSKRCTDFVPAYRAFLREHYGPDILGRLMLKQLDNELQVFPNPEHVIIEDGTDLYLKDVKLVLKTYPSETLLVNIGGNPIHSRATPTIYPYYLNQPPSKIAAHIRQMGEASCQS